jgi:hypothetical protein
VFPRLGHFRLLFFKPIATTTARDPPQSCSGRQAIIRLMAMAVICNMFHCMEYVSITWYTMYRPFSSITWTARGEGKMAQRLKEPAAADLAS